MKRFTKHFPHPDEGIDAVLELHVELEYPILLLNGDKWTLSQGDPQLVQLLIERYVSGWRAKLRVEAKNRSLQAQTAETLLHLGFEEESQ